MNEYRISDELKQVIKKITNVFGKTEEEMVKEFLSIRFSDEVIKRGPDKDFMDKYAWAIFIERYFPVTQEKSEPIYEDQEPIEGIDELKYDDESSLPEPAIEEPPVSEEEPPEPEIGDIRLPIEIDETPTLVEGMTPVTTSMIIIDGRLYEQIQGGRFVYLKDDKRTLGLISRVEHNGIMYLPIQNKFMTEKIIPLPTTAMEYGSAERLIEDIDKFIHKYLDISDQFRKLCSWYIVMTWVYDNLNTINYLRALGSFGKGKTRFLNVLGHLCYKPIMSAGAVTVAPIYRLQDMFHGTLCFDEFVWSKSSDMGDAITQILNSGVERGGYVLRCNTDRSNEVEPFDSFGPKLIAQRVLFDDNALNSRCITEEIKETKRDDIPLTLTPSFYVDAIILRNQLLCYRLRNWDKVSAEDSNKVKLPHVNKRLQQMLLPFAVTFYKFPRILEDLDKFAKKYSSSQIMDNAETLEGAIVYSLFMLRNPHMKSINQQVTAKDLFEKMKELGYEVEGLNVRTIGKVKSSLGIKSKQKTLLGVSKMSIVWDEDLMQELKLKYLTPDQMKIIDDYWKSVHEQDKQTFKI